jgi:hypothetical protein
VLVASGHRDAERRSGCFTWIDLPCAARKFAVRGEELGRLVGTAADEHDAC